GESYSIQTRCQHPFSAINLASRLITTNPQPLRNRTPLQTLNSLIFKEFSLSAVGVVRIIETSATASTPIFSLLSKRAFETGSAFPKLPHEPVEPEAQRVIKLRSSPWQTTPPPAVQLQEEESCRN
ncbi:hypothetical protein ACWKWZ_26285, partial [Metapseudomonas otitidis]